MDRPSAFTGDSRRYVGGKNAYGLRISITYNKPSRVSDSGLGVGRSSPKSLEIQVGYGTEAIRHVNARPDERSS